MLCAFNASVRFLNRLGPRRTFPCPNIGTLCTLAQASVLIELGVNEGDPSVVLLRLLIKKLEDTLCACKRGKDRGELLTQACDGLGEISCVLKEGDQLACGQREHCGIVSACCGDYHERSQYRGDSVVDIAQVSHYRHQASRPRICAGFRFAKVIVDLVKIPLDPVLTAEYLDDLLSFGHFLNIAVCLAESLLTLPKIRAAALAYRLYDDEHQSEHQYCDKGQCRAEYYHHDNNAYYPEEAVDDLRNALANHLTHAIRIVCIAAHNLAVGMLIEIPNGQFLHPCEHLLADIVQHTGGYAHHYPGISV